MTSAATHKLPTIRLALAVALLTTASTLTAQHRPSTDPLAGFDDYATAAMHEWRVPGMAVAVVRGDSVLLARGWGVRTLGNAAPVDAHTVFAIGSATKAFTGAALGMLVAEQKLRWDEPVTTYLPWFEMNDPWVTHAMTLRDLLLHRSGLSATDQLWYGTTRSREEVVRSLRNVTPSTSFRTRFQYQNLMYITAGEVLHAVSGQTWEDFVSARILTPLGMTESNTSVKAIAALSNVATPHAELEGTVRPIPWRNIDNAGPAGGVNSNVLDMAKWLRLWIHHGTVGGRQILTEATVREATTPQFLVDSPGMIARLMSPAFLGYGFGWFIEDFRGRKWVNHGGNIDGMAALVSFLPSEDIGVVILTNLNECDITFPLTANLFDRLLGIRPPRDYNADYLGSLRAREAARRARTPKPVPVANTKPSLPLGAYAGVYRSPLFGTATVRLEPTGSLSVQYDANPTGIGDLEHWNFDSFVAVMRDPMLGRIPVSFRLDADGGVGSMAFAIDGPVDWIRVK